MNILVTGCNGQLGNVIRDRQPRYPQIKWFNTDVAELDITDKDAVGRFVIENHIDGIINCAAYTAVDRAEDDVEKAKLLNVTGPANLAAAIEQTGGWLIHISTDYVFDGNHCKPYTEDEPTNPMSVYGKTKQEAEVAVMQLCRQTMVIRTAWLYSEYGNNFVKTMIRLGREREQLKVVYDQIGTPTYAGDLADAILTIVNKGINPGLYHFTNEGVISWYDFTKAIHELTGITTCEVLPIRSEEYPTKAHRPSFSVLDKQKIKATYGISIPYWRDSLQHCIHLLNEKES
ncbi:MAG: dTDP-4-dehydrorhamnose reductase [Prevotella sp.]|nr:dTDP-4-dehydrorhamnose reductase [Prevotella sp.]